MSSIQNKLYSGVKFTSLATILTTILQIVQMSVLGRELGPTIFGYIAIITIIVEYAMQFNIGLNEIVIQRKEISKSQLSSLYWFNVFAAVLFCVILMAGSSLIINGLGIQLDVLVLQTIAIVFVISAVGIQFQSLALKSLDYRTVSLVDTISGIIYFTVTVIALLVLNQGIWSYVWGQLANHITRTSMLIYYGQRKSILPALYFNVREITEFIRLGLYRLGATSLYYISSRLDQIMIGAILGSGALGYYAMASKLVLQPIQKLNPMIMRLTFPLFSKFQEDRDKLRNGFFQLLRIVSIVIAPLLMGIAVVAPVVVPLMLGNEWTNAIQIMQILTIYAFFRSMVNSTSSLMLSQGKVKFLFVWNFSFAIALTATLYLISTYVGDIAAVAWGLSILQMLSFVSSYWLRVRQSIGPCLVRLISSMGIPVVLASFMSLVVIISSSFMIYSDAINLLVEVTLGLACYVILLVLFQRDFIANIQHMFKKQKKQKLGRYMG